MKVRLIGAVFGLAAMVLGATAGLARGSGPVHDRASAAREVRRGPPHRTREVPWISGGG